MKKIILVLSIAVASYAANASYLYWQVDQSAVLEYNKNVPEGWYSAGQSSYAVLKTTTGQTFDLYDAEGQVLSGHAAINTAYYSNVGDGGYDYSYYVELYNSSNQLLAKSSTLNNSSGSDWTAGYAESIRTSSLSEIPSVQLWHVSSFTAVPEPTSALLMLFGAAFLGLKRKNRSIA